MFVDRCEWGLNPQVRGPRRTVIRSLVAVAGRPTGAALLAGPVADQGPAVAVGTLLVQVTERARLLSRLINSFTFEFPLDLDIQEIERARFSDVGLSKTKLAHISDHTNKRLKMMVHRRLAARTNEHL